VLELAAGASASIRVRLTASDATQDRAPLGAGFQRALAARQTEADQFYATVIPSTLRPGGAMVVRQALAGMLWGKQYYEYDVHRWLREHGVNPWDPNAPAARCATCPGITCSRAM
jgi:D-alanyl-D-alanine dipeptidase